MQKLAQGQLQFSPADIVRFLESPFASWMERLRLKRPAQVTPDEDSEELKLIAAEGFRHEKRFLASLQSEGRTVTKIEQTSESRRNTREANDHIKGSTTRSSSQALINRRPKERLSVEADSEGCSTITTEKQHENQGNRLLGPYGIKLLENCESRVRVDDRLFSSKRSTRLQAAA